MTWLCTCTSHWSFSFIIHVISCHCLFLLYLYPTVSENNWSSLWCSTFTGTLNQPHFTDFFHHHIISSHFVFSSSSHISWVIYYYYYDDVRPEITAAVPQDVSIESVTIGVSEIVRQLKTIKQK
jgi:hypothetical protein